MLGTTLQTFLSNRLNSAVLPLSAMPSTLFQKNVKLRATVDPKKSFILDELTVDTINDLMLSGSYFNKQPLGMTFKAFKN